MLPLFWNHHPFRRGKRVGRSPLKLAGVGDAPSLTEVPNRPFCLGPSADLVAQFGLEALLSPVAAQVAV